MIASLLGSGGLIGNPINKTCNICNKEKLITEFYKRKEHVIYANRPYKKDLSHKGDGFRSDCKECVKKTSLTNWHKMLPDSKKNKKLIFNYGLDIKQYKNKLEKQGGGCEICGSYIDGKGGIDHCHKTGKIRGILCSHCNAAIGHMNDGIERIQKAIKYLIKYGEENGI